MELYFENSKGQERVIATPSSVSEAFQNIKDFLNDHNYTMYYCRETFNKDNNMITYDVGSHTEFFHLKNIPSDQFPSLK